MMLEISLGNITNFVPYSSIDYFSMREYVGGAEYYIHVYRNDFKITKEQFEELHYHFKNVGMPITKRKNPLAPEGRVVKEGKV